MARTWTRAQLEAIEARNSDILVSAAAGSGKTAVLVERLIRLITDEKNPLEVDKLLVVTFTHAAAAEMRERIYNAINECLYLNPNSAYLKKQAVLLDSASINTIHSFCLDIIRSNISSSGVDPNFKIADSTEGALLKNEALTEVVDEMYDDEQYCNIFAELIDNYSSMKNPAPFFELIDSVYKLVMGLPNPKKWLSDAAAKFESSDNINEYLSIMAEKTTAYIKILLNRYDRIIELAKQDSLEKEIAFLTDERNRMESITARIGYDDIRSAAYSFIFAVYKGTSKKIESKYRDYIKSVRDSIKSDFNKNVFIYIKNNSDEELKMAAALMPKMGALSETVSRLIDRYNEKKQAKKLIDFNDMEHICCRLLTTPDGTASEIAQTIKNRFKAICIDEYQDTSRLQETIFSSIADERCLFMVGDAKQSIYGFRNTDASLIAEKKASYRQGENKEKRKIFLSNNFRSRKEILSFINLIFSRIMSTESGEIDYNDEEALIYPDTSLYDTETVNMLSKKTEIIIVDKNKNSSYGSFEADADAADEPEANETEAVIIAKKINELIQQKVMIMAKGEYRAITYRDIAVLSRSNTASLTFANIFNQFSIPSYCDSSNSFFETVEIETILSYLKVIDNPHRDIPLLTVLRSPIFALSSNELAGIRICDKKSSFYSAVLKAAETDGSICSIAKRIISKINEYVKMSAYSSVSELINHIYMDSGYYDYVGALAFGTIKQANLRTLYLRAVEYEKTSFKGLYNFVSFIEKYTASGGDFEASKIISEEQNVVRLMSIHKSKGLEFSVVFVCLMGKKFNMRDLSKPVILHPVLGYGPMYIDNELRYKQSNITRNAIAEKLSQQIKAEEMRILYVAMTRAEQKLFLIGSYSNVERRLSDLSVLTDEHKKLPPYNVLFAACQLDFVIMALLNHEKASVLRGSLSADLKTFNCDTPFEISIVNKEISMSELEKPCLNEKEYKENPEEYKKLIDFKYKFESDISLSRKYSVSELKRRAEKEDGVVYLYDKPLFLNERRASSLSAAQKGTAMHTVMEHINLKSKFTADFINSEVLRIKNEGFLNEAEAESIDIHKLMCFKSSAAGQLIDSADKVEREKTFAVLKTPRQLGLDADTETKVLLQGIIDCLVFKADDIYIIDYKTDYVKSKTEIIEKYKMQLELYSLAAEDIYSKKVKQRMLYLFDTNDCIVI